MIIESIAVSITASILAGSTYFITKYTKDYLDKKEFETVNGTIEEWYSGF